MSDAESTLPTTVKDDPISPALRELLAVFDDTLHDVKFPDVDNDALVASAAQVEQRFADMKRLEAALEDARKKLDESQETLLGKAQRAVAYARVYADGDVLLTSRLESISLPRQRPAKSTTTTATAAGEAAPKKRGRPPKNAAADSTLFTVPRDASASDSGLPESAEGAAVGEGVEAVVADAAASASPQSSSRNGRAQHAA